MIIHDQIHFFSETIASIKRNKNAMKGDFIFFTKVEEKTFLGKFKATKGAGDVHRIIPGPDYTGAVTGTSA